MPRQTKAQRKLRDAGLDPADWLRTPQDERAVADGCWIDVAAGERVCQFFSAFLCHSKGQWAGKQFALEPWERDIIVPVFAWKRADGTRRFRYLDVWVAKKNGKSAIASGLSLYMLVADGEAGAEVYNAAADRDQASIVFNEAANMVRSSPFLSRRLTIIQSLKRIVYADQAAVLRALTSATGTKEGLNASSITFDELHAWKDRALFDTLRYAGAARRQPLFVTISTAGEARESIGYEQYKLGRCLLDGTVEDTTRFVYIAEATKKDDWSKEETWRKANPNWGVSINPVEFREAFEEARQSPTKENTFRRYRLNQWTSQDVRWLNVERWNALNTGRKRDELKGRRCFAGLDLSSKLDLTALSLVFPDDIGGYDVASWFWMPEATARSKQERNKTPWLRWADAGWITLIPGEQIDHKVIRAALKQLGKDYQIEEVAFDPWTAEQFRIDAVDLDGVPEDLFTEVRQGFKTMSEPTKEFERLILAADIRHDDNPVLTHCVDNVAIKMDEAGNIKPNKQKSGDRIDGVVATIMALSRAMLSENRHTSAGPDIVIL